MNRLTRWLSPAVFLPVVVLALMLGACSSGVKDTDVTAKLEKTFPMTVESYKSGQFLLDGAVLSAVDLGGHFAYLRDQGQLPKRVLLKRSDDTKIHKQHLLAMARIELDYGVAVFYEKKGELKRLVVADKNDIPQLREHEKGVPLPDELKGTSARGGDHLPTGDGSGY
ncbi:hypothetical protein [Oleiagrimonas soli]|uniref:Uncharacterized protein n=1 Tax=Oleiagrimonas soli TaxID=1543381 RepID=A0A099CTL7_9GAMM|nr:hypothetical protein [Oleiagrimonas soli]KGI77323.1 hypothetical protein LF63_0110580 [Oleiagrimonas soli]MBB6182766.1 hypothetical protein [Oleiagrimonas soli]